MESNLQTHINKPVVNFSENINLLNELYLYKSKIKTWLYMIDMDIEEYYNYKLQNKIPAEYDEKTIGQLLLAKLNSFTDIQDYDRFLSAIIDFKACVLKENPHELISYLRKKELRKIKECNIYAYIQIQCLVKDRCSQGKKLNNKVYNIDDLLNYSIIPSAQCKFKPYDSKVPICRCHFTPLTVDELKNMKSKRISKII